MATAPRDERPLRAYKRSNRFVIGTKLLGTRVRELRLAKGWTLERASERMHVDFAHLQKIEAGRVNITFGTFLRIADGLGQAPGALFESFIGDRSAPAKTGARPGSPSKTPIRVAGGRTVTYGSSPSKEEREAAIRDQGSSVLRDTGQRVSELRAKLGMSQQGLARSVGVSVGYVRRVEAGQQNLTLRSLVRLAWGLGVHVAGLLEPPSGVRYARRRTK
jgi:transcriptional regulator with XRE-family HTH domain